MRYEYWLLIITAAWLIMVVLLMMKIIKDLDI